jgi:sugar lactone lactonase YvrE
MLRFRLGRRGGAAFALWIIVSACSPPFGSSGIGNGSVGDIEVVAEVDETYGPPNDAVPSPDGSAIYFTVHFPPQIYKTSGTVKEPTPIPLGPGMLVLYGLSISTDGNTLYLAGTGEGAKGVLASLPVTGGSPTPVRGTEGTEPEGTEVVNEGGRDVIYFAGKDPSDGAPAVFRVPAGGGELTVLAKGGPLEHPDRVAVGRSGKVYVTDRDGGSLDGAVFRLDGNTPVRLADQVFLGLPAGVAVTEDEKLLLVSSRNANEDTAQVFVIDLATNKTGVVDKVIGENQDAGGLHRAHNANVFAWADVLNRVYRF